MSGSSLDELEEELVRALQRDDRRAIADLYLRGAEIHQSGHDEDAAAFYFTQAMVFALDAGDDAVAAAARAELVRLGRDI